MNEIKFKGYVIEKLDYVQWINDGHGIHKIEYSDGTEPTYLLLTPNRDYKVYRDSIGQYIGKKDIFGIEIFSGDILRYPTPDDKGEYFIVKWDNENCRFMACGMDKDITLDCKEWSKCEIIGNQFRPENQGKTRKLNL